MIDALIASLHARGPGFGLVGWGESALQAGGKSYRLAWGVAAAAILERAAGKPYAELLDQVDPAKVRVADLRLLLWAILSVHQPGITLEEAGEVLDKADRVELAKALVEAFTSGNPQPRPDEDPPDPKTAGLEPAASMTS